MTLRKLPYNAFREEGAGRQAVESTGGVPPWGSGANRPRPETDGPVNGLLL